MGVRPTPTLRPCLLPTLSLTHLPMLKPVVVIAAMVVAAAAEQQRQTWRVQI